MTADSRGDALAAAVDALTAAGVDSPRLDAELLLCAAASLEPQDLAAYPEAALDAGAGRRFGAAVRRRLRREPVAYILGRRSFRYLELMVDRRALIPRPETELLVEVALELLDPAEGGSAGGMASRPTQSFEPDGDPGSGASGPGGADGRAPHVLDVGTGSGAIALAIASERPGWRVTGVDTSHEALSLARENAVRLGLTGQVEFHAVGADARTCAAPTGSPGSVADAADALGPGDVVQFGGGAGSFDLVVANLPYVPDAEWDDLAPEIREYEPREALVGGPDGLDVIRELIERGMPETGALALEIGAGQGDEVTAILDRAGWPGIEVRQDLAGLDRVVITDSRRG